MVAKYVGDRFNIVILINLAPAPEIVHYVYQGVCCKGVWYCFN